MKKVILFVVFMILMAGVAWGGTVPCMQPGCGQIEKTIYPTSNYAINKDRAGNVVSVELWPNSSITTHGDSTVSGTIEWAIGQLPNAWKVPIGDITTANPCVVTYNGHGYATGDWVELAKNGGGTFYALDNNIYAITVLTANTFSLQDPDDGTDIDCSGMGAWDNNSGRARLRRVTDATGGAIILNPGQYPVYSAAADGTGEIQIINESDIRIMCKSPEAIITAKGGIADEQSLVVSYSDRTVIEGCTFVGMGIDTTTDQECLHYSYSDYGDIYHNYFTQCGGSYGAVDYSSSGYSKIMQNTFVDNYKAVSLSGKTRQNRNNLLTGNLVKTTVHAGNNDFEQFAFDYPYYTQVTNNTFINEGTSGKSAILFLGSFNHIGENIVSGNIITGGGHYYGISLDNGDSANHSSDNMIISNNVVDTPDTGTAARSPIFLDDGADNNKIFGNSLYGGGSQSISFHSGTTGNVVYNNYLEDEWITDGNTTQGNIIFQNNTGGGVITATAITCSTTDCPESDLFLTYRYNVTVNDLAGDATLTIPDGQYPGQRVSIQFTTKVELENLVVDLEAGSTAADASQDICTFTAAGEEIVIEWDGTAWYVIKDLISGGGCA